MAAGFTREEILGQLDACADGYVFPMLDNGYVYLGATRLTAYRDERRWAVAIEVLGFSPRPGGHDGLNNCLHLYGNCLDRPPGTANGDFLVVTSDAPDGPVFEDEFSETVLPDATSICIRGQVVPLDLSPAGLAAKGVDLAASPDVSGADLVRSLVPDHADLLFATEEELRARVPADLPQVLRLGAWHHPDLAAGERPGQSPTFRMIADVLVTGDASLYQPHLPPNTHWKHWPDGGTL